MRQTRLEVDTRKPYLGSKQSIHRRADWCFLTANPSSAKVLCFQDGLLAEALGLISEPPINSSQSAPAPEDCSLAIGLNPNTRILRKARSALRLGGCCYVEWEVHQICGINIKI